MPCACHLRKLTQSVVPSPVLGSVFLLYIMIFLLLYINIILFLSSSSSSSINIILYYIILLLAPALLGGSCWDNQTVHSYCWLGYYSCLMASSLGCETNNKWQHDRLDRWDAAYTCVSKMYHDVPIVQYAEEQGLCFVARTTTKFEACLEPASHSEFSCRSAAGMTAGLSAVENSDCI